MGNRRRLALLALVVAVLAVACDPVRVSVTSSGAQGNAVSLAPSIADDARVAFTSYASNLVAGDTNGESDVFVRDYAKNTTTRVSVASGGQQGNSRSDQGEISADGRFVAFVSYATNLVSPAPTGVVGGVYVHDLQTGSTALVSRTGPTTPVSILDEPIAISSTGRFVAFAGAAGVYRYDSTTGVASLVLNGNALVKGITSDGRYLATDTAVETGIHSTQSNVVDLTNGTTRFGPGSNSYGIRISRDGRYVVYAYAPDCFPSFMPECTAGPSGVNLRDLTTGTEVPVLRVVGPPALQVNSVDLSTDGRWVALGVGQNVFRFDRQTDTFLLVTVAPGQNDANGPSGEVRITGDGGTLAFQSSATNLVGNDTNAVDDVFVRHP
ncbi:MAG TPA: hypothetical protein VIB48_13480 [Acidimicrobiia bacterium]|jgi:hypothetical protein